MPNSLTSETRSTRRELTQRGVLWVGLRCDVRCKFCYDEKVAAGDKIWLPFDHAVAALAKFRSYYANTAVDFMGGEPTLHPRIVDIVAYASGIGLKPTIITHGMHLANADFAAALGAAGVRDFLVSIHAIGDRVQAVHQRGRNNYDRQVAGLDNLRQLGIPFRFNCTVIRDNLDQLAAIAVLAAEKGARVVNFLTFNPYFEWAKEPEIAFQAKFSEIRPYLERAIDKCTELGVEANVRYMPICQLPGREAHVYTGFQLPYDTHEWDYNSWYDLGHAGRPNADWYLEASRLQRRRHNYVHVEGCDSCSVKSICDGFHSQYVARWGGDEAEPISGESVRDPRYFIDSQSKVEYLADEAAELATVNAWIEELAATQFSDTLEHRAGVKVSMPRTNGTKGL